MSKLPRSLKVQPLPRLRSINRFTRDADYIMGRSGELWRVADSTARVALISDDDRAVLARCEQAQDLFDPPDCYDDAETADRTLRVEVIGQRIALLVGGFPSGAPGDPDVYVNLLIEQIDAVEGLSLPALDAAVYQIIGTQKFLPTASEVLAVVNEQNEEWDQRMHAIAALGHWVRGGDWSRG